MSDAGNQPHLTRLERTRQRHQRQRGRSDAARGALVGTKLLAALLAAAIMIGTGYVALSYNSFIGNITTVQGVISPTTGAAGPKGSGANANPGSVDPDGVDQNILLVGDDDRTGASPAELKLLNTQDDGGGVNTDTLMILHVPANGTRATGISIPRDSYVNVPGLGMSKINAAYEFGTRNGKGPSGGAAMLINVLQTLTGLHIDHYVAVTLLGFYRIAEALGPINVCLNNKVDDKYSETYLPKGISTLNASQALSFVRQRHGLTSDLDREVRQQYFLATEFRKLTSAGTLLNPLKLQNLLHAVSSSLTVDPGLAGTGLLKFAEQVQNLSAGNVTFAIIPIVGTPTISTDSGPLSIVKVDPAAVKTFVAKTIGVPDPSASLSTVTAAPPAKVSVQVVNASNTDGAAARATTTLTTLGFQTLAPTSADTAVQATTITYPAGAVDQAKALAAYIPGAQLQVGGSGSALTLTLGLDGQQVNPTTSAGSSSAPAPAPSANASSSSSEVHTGSGSAGSTPRAFGASECIN